MPRQINERARQAYIAEAEYSIEHAQEQFEAATLAGDDAMMEYWSEMCRHYEANLAFARTAMAPRQYRTVGPHHA